MKDVSRSANRVWLAILAILLLSTSLACSLGQMLVGEPTPTPTLVPAIVPPTWTPSPVGQLSPGQIATLTVIAGISFPTLTPTPTEIVTPTPTPTFAPPPPPPDTPTPVPTPYVVVAAPQVNLRSGPSVAYPVIGQAVKDQTFAITGRNDAFTWWQVCCIDGQQGWITTQLTAPGGPADTVPIVAPPELPQLPPTPIPGQHTRSGSSNACAGARLSVLAGRRTGALGNQQRLADDLAEGVLRQTADLIWRQQATASKYCATE